MVSGSPLSGLAVPLLIILVFSLYPILVYKHLVNNKENLLSRDEQNLTYLRHNSAYAMFIMEEDNFRPHLRIGMLIHFRRLVYAIIIVWLDHMIIIQLGLTMMISIGMMIMIFNYRPYISRKESW